MRSWVCQNQQPRRVDILGPSTYHDEVVLRPYPANRSARRCRSRRSGVSAWRVRLLARPWPLRAGRPIGRVPDTTCWRERLSPGPRRPQHPGGLQPIHLASDTDVVKNIPCAFYASFCPTTPSRRVPPIAKDLTAGLQLPGLRWTSPADHRYGNLPASGWCLKACIHGRPGNSIGLGCAGSMQRQTPSWERGVSVAAGTRCKRRRSCSLTRLPE